MKAGLDASQSLMHPSVGLGEDGATDPCLPLFLRLDLEKLGNARRFAAHSIDVHRCPPNGSARGELGKGLPPSAARGGRWEDVGAGLAGAASRGALAPSRALDL